ncbi:MAG: ABC transporter substrate-binding protein, partial [Alphaproteobacteria bacterium]|nr:ABC transporter substrate-binding protein [Alphaproteobacteria bacterium]MDA7989349.1 ABC transporter substrate-binding protein [Alphaproteobacteria bacterium]
MSKRYDRDPQTGKKFHSYVPEIADDLRAGKVGRRDFLRTVTLLGVSAGTAYAMASDILGEDIRPQRASAQTPKRGGTVRSAMRVQRMDDPAIYDWVERSNQSRGIVEHISRTDVNNITTPYLAEGWEASEDLKTWTINLRRGVKWSNGDDFNADDLVFNLNRWVDPDTGSSNLGLFSALKPGNVEKTGSHSVRMTLDSPVLQIPENFYNYPTAIMHRRFSDEGGDFSKNPVGTGPMTLVDLVVGEYCELRKRADEYGYWDRDPYIDGIVYRDYGDDPQAPISAFAAGEVDHLYEVAVNSLDVAERLPNAVISETPTGQTGICRFRQTETPFDNKKLRQAFNAALDHDETLQLAYRGRGLAGENHHVGEVHPEYFALPKPKRDVELAKRLLAESGLGPSVDLKIDLGASDDWHRNACAAMKQQLAPAGINLELNVMPGATYWDVWDSTPLGFTQWTHRPLGVMVLNLAYRSGVPWNEAAYANPEFDRQLDVAGSILDVDERRKQMEVVQKILQDDAVFAQPLWRSVFNISRDNLRG